MNPGEKRYPDDLLKKLRANIGQVLIGKQEAIELLLNALLCHGHCLIEDVPGVGKTTLAHAFARSLGLDFQRIQFTPDVLPSDITGYTVYDLKQGAMTFHPGAIMSQIILADEINRSSPKTQSSLLEAMQEGQVTVDGQTYPLPQPFMVLATQNPIEFAGTFPLPEAQLDRFLLRIHLGYPSPTEEMAILQQHLTPRMVQELPAVVTQVEITALQQTCAEVLASEPILEYITRLVAWTRVQESITLGISPRGGIALMQAARAKAFLAGRTFVIPDDVQSMLEPVWSHRLVLRPEAALDRTALAKLFGRLIRETKIPTLS
ncbi:MAG: MoxR family ATPase [Eubacteriales bacterium]|nr:MoxR family ATPase [Eubacteriales bacterium]